MVGSDTPLASAMRTLLVSGYSIRDVNRVSKNATILIAEKRDRLGAQSRSAILLADDPPPNVLQMLATTAGSHDAQALLVSNGMSSHQPKLDRSTFFELLGGEVRSHILMRDDLPDVMDELGHNRLPSGFSGKADDLLEDFVKEGLEFLLESRGYRYGQDRRFESLPDGVNLGPNRLNLYFDGKAYEQGFHPSADDIKRFAAYANEFNRRYEQLVGRLYCFVVVSGSFSASTDAIGEKADEFYSMCNTKLCHITARNFGSIILELRKNSVSRSAINWPRIFSRNVIEVSDVTSEIKRVQKDKVSNN